MAYKFTMIPKTDRQDFHRTWQKLYEALSILETAIEDTVAAAEEIECWAEDMAREAQETESDDYDAYEAIRDFFAELRANVEEMSPPEMPEGAEKIDPEVFG